MFCKMCCRRLIRVLIFITVFIFPFANCLMPNLTDHLIDRRNLVTTNSGLFEESRKRKKKDNYIMGLILGAILIKMILFPLAVKAMAIMSSVSVLLSTMSLIMSSIVGYAKLATQKPQEPLVRLVRYNDIWAKGDENYIPPESFEYSPNVPLEQMNYSIK